METVALPAAGAEEVLNLRRRYNHQKEAGDVCLGFEYLGAHGYVMEYFWAQPSQRLMQDERLEGQPVESMKVFQCPDGSWQMQLRVEGSQTPQPYTMAEAEVEKLLADGGEHLYAQPPKGQEWHPISE